MEERRRAVGGPRGGPDAGAYAAPAAAFSSLGIVPNT